ncbi:MAG: pitrilysin family protein [Oscillospiraceae bacterium]
MEKQIIKNDILNEQYYHYKHKSGLSIILYPMEGYSSAYALFGTNYGSIDTCFKTQNDKEFITVPEGIAHFLEHKLFESEDGDAFSLFAKTGASANAFTSFDKTCYLFSTTDNFEESLKALITFVQAPYFTQETVEKEQGIIGQEIKMYEDDPNWRVFFNLLTALYVNNPVRIDIAGTTQSIAKIDKDLLYSCYNTFYNLNNMVVCIAGNFDEESASKIIEENLKECDKVEVTAKVPEEPETVAKKEFVQNLSVAMPLFNIGYKENPVAKQDELATQIKCELILSAVVGRGSDLYKELYDSSLINATFGTEVFSGRGYFANVFSGESRNPKQVMEKIANCFELYKVKGIDEDTFKRVQKAMYGNSILLFNDVEGVANELVASYFADGEIYDVIDVIKAVTLEEVNEQLRSSFNREHMAISIVNPVE